MLLTQGTLCVLSSHAFDKHAWSTHARVGSVPVTPVALAPGAHGRAAASATQSGRTGEGCPVLSGGVGRRHFLVTLLSDARSGLREPLAFMERSGEV